jgi:hypothetical protein
VAAGGEQAGGGGMNFQELNERLAAAKQALTLKIEIELGEIFLAVTRMYSEVKVRHAVFQEVARLLAENAEMERRHLDDLGKIRHLQAQLKASRSENSLPHLRRISS